MKRDLIFMSCLPYNTYFWWQLKVQLENFRKHGYSDKYHVLIFKGSGDKNRVDPKYEKLKTDYPEVQFFEYCDEHNECYKFVNAFQYIPLQRPWTLSKHFKLHPHLKEKAIFYTDQDVIFIKTIDFDKYLHDDINYLSWTGNRDTKWNYLSYSYLEGKKSRVRPLRKALYEKNNPLEELFGRIGVTKEIVESNELNTGGAQYLLKNIDSQYWDNVFDSCMFIKTFMGNANQNYMEGQPGQEREDNGWQSWCADMWAVLWNLWKRGDKTECPREFDFLWCTDPIEMAADHNIYHHAGQSTLNRNNKNHTLFNKRKHEYIHNHLTPFEDLEYISSTSKEFAARIYAEAVISTAETL